MLRLKEAEKLLEDMAKVMEFNAKEAYIETINTETSGAIRIKASFRKAGCWVTVESPINDSNLTELKLEVKNKDLPPDPFEGSGY